MMHTYTYIGCRFFLAICCGFCVLQGISYAKLANLPPIVGLYSSLVPLFIYSILGSSRHLDVGPVSITSLVMGSMLREADSYSQDPILYLQMAFTATFFAGFQASSGLLRLGFIIDFLSKATPVGFIAGAAVIVLLQQLKGLHGIIHFTRKMQSIPVMSSDFHQRDEAEWRWILIHWEPSELHSRIWAVPNW